MATFVATSYDDDDGKFSGVTREGTGGRTATDDTLQGGDT